MTPQSPKWPPQQDDHIGPLTKDIDPPESSTYLAWISRAGIVALRICSHALFWGRVPTPTFFAWANRFCWYMGWSQIIDFRLQTNNRSTVHACQGMTSNQAEHSTVVGTVKGQWCHFFTCFVSYMPYLVRDLFHSRWPWTRTGNVLCQESRTHCPFQSENDSDPDANSGWMILGWRQQDKQANDVQIQLFHGSTNGQQGPRKQEVGDKQKPHIGLPVNQDPDCLGDFWTRQDSVCLVGVLCI